MVYHTNFPNLKGPRAPSQNCKKNPWLCHSRCQYWKVCLLVNFVQNDYIIWCRFFFGLFWWPIFGRVPNAKKYVFFPIWIRKFPIQGTKKPGEKITKYRHFKMFMFVVERAGPNSPNDTREITKYCKLPNGNVPLRQFSRIYSRRCRGVCNKHTWFILLVPYSGVLI